MESNIKVSRIIDILREEHDRTTVATATVERYVASHESAENDPSVSLSVAYIKGRQSVVCSLLVYIAEASGNTVSPVVAEEHLMNEIKFANLRQILSEVDAA